MEVVVCERLIVFEVVVDVVDFSFIEGDVWIVFVEDVVCVVMYVI